MWTVGVLCVLLTVLAVWTTGQMVHFDLTNKDCGQNSSLVGQCGLLYEKVMEDAFKTNNYTIELDCRMILERIACVETALCHCNFSADHPEIARGYRTNMILSHLFNNLTQCGNETYGDSIMSDVIGPFDVQAGINCSQYNMTVGDLAVSLGVAHIPEVLHLEEVCPGIQSCYLRFDRAQEIALYQKHWPQFCTAHEDLLDCLVNASCSCNQTTHENVMQMMESERQLFRQSCARISNPEKLLDSGIRCPSFNRCEAEFPTQDCAVEFQAALIVATGYQDQCGAVKRLANCTENVACECGFYQNPQYLRALAASKHSYTNTPQCLLLTGPFPNHTGLACGEDDRFTEAEKVISVSLALPSFVNAEELTCSGVQNCYDTANSMSSLAHHAKNLTAICQAEADLVVCLEEAYCACGRLNELEVNSRVSFMRQNHQAVCFVLNNGKIPKKRCVDCNSPSTSNTCQPEYLDFISSQNQTQLCTSLYALANCTENMACMCGFQNEPSFYRAVAVAKHTYQNNNCQAVNGLFPNHTDLACTPGDNFTETDKILTIALAQDPQVAEEDATCPGIKKCFEIADVKSTEAHRMKDLTALCQTESERQQCVEEAYCQCGRLFEEEVEKRLQTDKFNYLSLCYDVTGFIPLKKCKGLSNCRRNDPMTVCREGYQSDIIVAGNDVKLMCQASKNYILCTEEVGCACGMLADGKSDEAASIYNFTTMSLQVYEEAGCANEIGMIPVQEDGIKCEGQPDDSVRRRLVLSYADSAEVAALSTDCEGAKTCFQEGDRARGQALYSRNFRQLCQAQLKLYGCLDKAYCECKVHDQPQTVAYMQTQLRTHNDNCELISPFVTSKTCKQITGAADVPRTSFLMRSALLLVAAVSTILW